MADDWVERLNAFYAAYMAYFGVEADVVEAGSMDAKDRATIAGLRAAQADRNPEGHDPAEGHGAKHESPVDEADAPERCSEHSIHSSSGRG